MNETNTYNLTTNRCQLFKKPIKMKNIDQKIKTLQENIYSILGDYLPSYDETGNSDTIQMTFSTCNNLEELNFQSGDNSFSGACYFHKHWAVTELSAEDDLEELSIQLAEQLADCVLKQIQLSK